jgi:ABC-2 type transport system permease protein
VAQSAVVVVVQSLIMIGLALAVEASFPGGVLGVLVLVLVAGLLGASFGALSNSLALVTRQEESLIGAVTFLVLPLTFLSTALMRHDLLPGWMRTAADVNPVDWAIEAGRSATAASPDWGLVATNTALLAALLAVCATLATRAFRSYQRSV